MEQEFEIIEVFDVGNYTYITARQMQIGLPFNVTNFGRLGNIQLEKYLDQPRAVDKQGNIRADIFVFCCSALSAKPNKGSVVPLTNS